MPYLLRITAAIALVAAPSATSPASSGDWDARGDLVLSPADALSALDSLPPDAPAAASWSEGGRARAGSARHGRTLTVTAAILATRFSPGT